MALALLYVSGLAACGADSTPEPPSATTPDEPGAELLPLDTYPWTGATSLAAVHGVLAAERRGQAGCTWLEHNGHRMYLIWPAGFRLRATDLALIDPEGVVFARAGDHVRGPAAWPGTQAAPCRCAGYTGEFWSIAPEKDGRPNRGH